MPNTTLKSLLPQHYADVVDDLLADVAVRHNSQKDHLTLFWPMVGKHYEPGRGLLLVGRAPNGWDAQWYSNEAADPSRRAAIIGEAKRLGEWGFAKGPGHCPLAWVTANAGKADGYNTNRSAFWRTARHIVTKLYGEDLDPDRWASSIAWTDLFKVAPAEAGSPSGALQKTQLDRCVDLLRLEVEALRPARVLLFTGMDWAKPFLTRLGVQVVPYAGDLVQAVGTLGDQKWAVAKHPQGKDESEFTKQSIAELGEA